MDMQGEKKKKCAWESSELYTQVEKRGCRVDPCEFSCEDEWE